MDKKRILVLLVLGIFLFNMVPAQAAELTEGDVQAAVDAQGKEAVAGNLLIWFLCATAFLKISQRMDSFLNMLGVNVGHTGGGAFSDAMVAMKSLAGMARLSGGANSPRQHTDRASSAGKAAASGGFTGGLAGMVARQAIGKTAAQATGEATGGMMANMANALYDRSLGKSAGFAQDVISNIATTDGGIMTGDKALNAFQAYVGSDQTVADGEMLIDTAPSHEAAATDPTAGAASLSPNAMQESDFIPTTHGNTTSPDSNMSASISPTEKWSALQSAEGLEVPEVAADDVFGLSPSPTIDDATYGTSSGSLPINDEIVSSGLTDIPTEPQNSSVAIASEDGITLAGGNNLAEATPDIPITSSSIADTSPDSLTGAESTAQMAAIAASGGSSDTASRTTSPTAASPNTATIPPSPQYRDIEIGRGQIRGVEITPQHPEGIGFAMYHTGKYRRPEDDPYVTVQTADGARWYKQYAQPVVKRTPVAEVHDKVEQKERIVYKLPKAPQQKTKV